MATIYIQLLAHFGNNHKDPAVAESLSPYIYMVNVFTQLTQIYPTKLLERSPQKLERPKGLGWSCFFEANWT